MNLFYPLPQVYKKNVSPGEGAKIWIVQLWTYIFSMVILPGPCYILGILIVYCTLTFATGRGGERADTCREIGRNVLQPSSVEFQNCCHPTLSRSQGRKVWPLVMLSHCLEGRNFPRCPPCPLCQGANAAAWILKPIATETQPSPSPCSSWDSFAEIAQERSTEHGHSEPGVALRHQVVEAGSIHPASGISLQLCNCNPWFYFVFHFFFFFFFPPLDEFSPQTGTNGQSCSARAGVLHV